MAITQTEVGKIFRCATNFNLSSASDIKLTFQHNSGEGFSASMPNITVPDVDVIDESLGNLTAGTYVEYVTTGTDFIKSGLWYAVIEYQDSSPKLFFGARAEFNILSKFN